MRLAAHWAFWTITTGLVLVWWAGSSYEAGLVDAAVRDGETAQSEVVRFDDQGDYIDIFVQVDGKDYLLFDWFTPWSWGSIQLYFEEQPDYEIGDTVEVALSPDPDPEYNWAYDVRLYPEFSWSAALLGLLFMLGIVGLARSLLVRSATLREGARWQWWRTRRPFTVRITEVREWRPNPLHRFWRDLREMFGDHQHEVHHLVIEKDGAHRFWAVKTSGPVTIEPGLEIQVVGRWRHRGWLLGLTEPPLYPAERLD